MKIIGLGGTLELAASSGPVSGMLILVKTPSQRARIRWLEEPFAQGISGVRLAPIGAALASALLVAITGTAGVALLILVVLGFPSLEPAHKMPLEQLLDVIKLAFAAIAGIGGVIALVVAYRRQRVIEASAQLEHAREERERVRVFNERFATAAGQLGSDEPAVRLAGAYAMAALADDWRDQRQTCVNILCGYLRMPYESAPGKRAPAAQRIAFARNREVRHAIISIIRERLNPWIGTVLWQDCRFDFTGVVFDGGSFAGIEVPAGCFLDFLDAKFIAGRTTFDGARFSGGIVNFWRMDFAGGEVTFHGAKFTGGHVGFGDCLFNGSKVAFSSIETSDGPYDVLFSGTEVTFAGARLSAGEVSFARAEFKGGKVDFRNADFSGAKVTFRDTSFTGGEVAFAEAANWSVAPSDLPRSAPGLTLPAVSP